MSNDQLIPETEARTIILNDVDPVPEELVSLDQAATRVISKDLAALRTQPPFNASAMDGYAVRQADVKNIPVTLKVVGISRAGEPYTANVKAGEAVRIFTGAVVPGNADSIIIQENANAEGKNVEILSGVPAGKFIRPSGLDFKEDDVLLLKGTQLTPNRLALAASMNYAKVPVYRKPKVALMATGDELLPPGQEVGPGQIIASNTFGLVAAASACGAEVVDFGIVKDTCEALSTAINSAIAESCDIIITTGGASVGDHDLVKPVAEQCGFAFKITKIAMRPGKPFLFGLRKNNSQTIRLTGLAGNPVSSLVAFNAFVRPLIHLLSGRETEITNMQIAKLGRDLPENDERAEYMRATLDTDENGNLIATPFENQDSSMLAQLVQADCLVYREVNAKAATKGDVCSIVLI